MSLTYQANLSTGQVPSQQTSRKSPVPAFSCLPIKFQRAAIRRSAGKLPGSQALILAALGLVVSSALGQSPFATWPNWQNLGTTAAAQNVTVTATAAGSVKTVEVLTNGATGAAIATPEFAKGGGASSCETATLAVGGTCEESVTFTPAYPGLRIGAVVLLDGNGNVLGTADISGVGQGGLDVLVPGNQIQLAGVFKQAGGPTNGFAAGTTELRQPASVALDGAGNLYIADSANNEIRMVCFSATSATIEGVTCPGAGIVVDIAGTGAAGYSGDNGPASSASVTLNAPGGLTLDGAGNLYIADTNNNVVRKITAATGVIATVAGDGTAGYGGDGSLATASGVELYKPWGVTIDPVGNIFIADTYNQRIRRVDAVTGVITTAAGNGTPSGLGDGKGTFGGDNGPANAAGLSLPYAVAFDGYGNMFIPDSGNNRIRAVEATNGVITATSKITSVVGSGTAGGGCGNGPTNAATLNSPEGVAIDPAFNIYISDTGDECIRKANVTSGQIVQLAETNDNAITLAGVVDEADVFEPIGIVLDGLGNVYYADYYFMQIDEIQSDVAVLNYQETPIRQGDLSVAQVQIVENDGNASDSNASHVDVSSDITAITPDINAQVDAATTTCNPLPFALTEDDDCNVGGIFAPSTTINPATLPGAVIGNIYVANVTVNPKLDIVLVGEATPVNSTNIALTSAPDPSAFGQTVVFTATVTTGANTGALNGAVTFTDTFNGVTKQMGVPITVNGSGVAVIDYATLAVGTHTISATYGGDSMHLKSETPATVQQTVYEATQTTVTAVPASPSQLGQSVVFTATVTTPNGGGVALDGTVTFTDSLVVFANNTVAINNGTATFTAANLVQGVNAITAVYTPASTKLIQGSQGTLNQDVVSPSSFSVTSAPNPSIFGSLVTFTINVPNQGAAAATGKVNIVITPGGQTTPTYPLTVTLAGNPAAGTATISTLPVGTYNATATYGGDMNYAQSTAALATPQVVNQVLTSTKLAANPNPGIAGQQVTISATVTPSSGTGVPTGTVSFADTFNGVTVTLGAPTLSATGVGTFNTSTLAPGTHSITANYAGDADDAASSATLSLVIDQAATATVVTATPSPATVGGTITFTATVATTPAGGAPTGAVNFLANGTIALGTANLDPTGKATVTNATLAAGSYQITAVYAGDTDDAGSTSPAITEVVGLIPTDTTLSTATATGANSQTILVSTVANAGVTGPPPAGTVNFQNGSTVVGSATLNADGVATLTPNLGAGLYTIIAYYQGDATHSPSQSPPVAVTSTGSSFTITVTPNSLSIPTTQNMNVNVSLTSVSGFADTVGLGCASLPAGVNCHFSNISVALGANATATATLTIDTNNPLGGGQTAMNRQAGGRKVAMAGLFLPLSFLLGWILWRFRKRHASAWSLVLILVLSGAAMLATGCSGFSQNTAAPGTYTFQVVGVGASSDVTEYQNVTLNITN